MDDCKLAINWKKHSKVPICWHDLIISFFDISMFLLSSLVTNPSFMSVLWLVLELWKVIFVYKGFTRNPEIGNISLWVLNNICKLRLVTDSKFGTNVSNKTLLNDKNCYSDTGFTVSGLLRENQQGGWVKIQPRNLN